MFPCVRSGFILRYASLRSAQFKFTKDYAIVPRSKVARYGSEVRFAREDSIVGGYTLAFACEVDSVTGKFEVCVFGFVRFRNVFGWGGDVVFFTTWLLLLIQFLYIEFNYSKY